MYAILSVQFYTTTNNQYYHNNDLAARPPRTFYTQPKEDAPHDECKMPLYIVREVMQRELSVDQQGCHFFDIHDSFITWNGSTHALPCKEYSHNCYKKKLILLFKMVILNPVHQETFLMRLKQKV